MRVCAASPQDAPHAPPTLKWHETKSFSDAWPQVPPALDHSELESLYMSVLPLAQPIVEVGSSMRLVTKEDALKAAVGGAAVVHAQSCAAAPAAVHM